MFISIYGDKQQFNQDPIVQQVTESGFDVHHTQKEHAESLGMEHFSSDGCMAVMSPVDEQSKFSEGFAQCIGIAAIATEKNTRQELSFVCHADPGCFMGNQSHFRNFIQKTLMDLMERSMDSSLDVVIFGGETVPHWECEEESFVRRIKYLDDIVSSVSGISPTVLIPKFNRPFNTTFCLDTKSRRAVLVQPLPEKLNVNGSFGAREVTKHVQQWRVEARDKLGPSLAGCYFYETY